MDSLARGFLDRIRAGITAKRDLSFLSEWVIRNTRHPKDSSKPWSFFEHEFQLGILNDPTNDQVVKKCAQVGMSEIAVRMALGLADIYQPITIIYTLPTATDAALFAKSRFDDAILNSPELRGKMNRDTDSASLKKIGASFLYIRGTFSQKAAISIPASILVNDEVDHSDPVTLSSFTSRLGHEKEGDIIRRRFSTPTVSGYGVSELFDGSTQNWRAVKCDHCHSWQIPKFLDDVIIPGYSQQIMKLEKEDLQDHRFNIRGAYLSCPGCHGRLTINNLLDPVKRQWVEAKPGAERSGFQVQPFDVPTINTVPRTLRAMTHYKRKADWINFAVGQDFQDSETSFVAEAVKKAHCLDWIQPRLAAARGTVIGVDVGKTSWILVARENDRRGLDVLHYERIKLVDEEALPARAEELFRWYGTVMLVVDAGPEWTQALSIISRLPEGKAYACYYKTPAKPTLTFTDVDEDAKVVTADRTAIITDTAKKVNGGMTRFCRCPDQPTMEAHLDVMKRVTRPNAKGNDQNIWVNTGNKPDHFAHALFFASIANNLLSFKPKSIVIPALPMPGKVKIGGKTDLIKVQVARSYHDRY